MRIILLMSVLVGTLSCSTTSPFISYSGKVSIVGSNASIISNSGFFNNESIEIADSMLMIDERADHYLNLVLEGYYEQTGHFEFSDSQNAAMYFDIQEVSVKTGHFSLNLVDPGPILRMKMLVDVYSEGTYVYTETYRTRVNMAQIINPDKLWNWLSIEEKQNVDNQLATFEIGLRTLYRNLFFKHLDISLSL